MQSTAVVALALLESVSAFQAPAMKASTKAVRATMLGFLHVIALKAGVVMPGYLSTSQGLKFADVPTGCFSSLEGVPTAGWLQIMALTCMQEAGTGFASKAQADGDIAGDIALDS